MTVAATEALRLRREAEAGPIGKKRSSFELYSLLRKCYWLAEVCARDKAEEAELRRLVSEQPKGDRNRRFVEHGSSVFLAVARFVFSHEGGSADRSNASRYGMAMECAHDKRLDPIEFERRLREEGGIRAFRKRREPVPATAWIKQLELTRAVEAPLGGLISLTLRRLDDGRFEVVHHEKEKAA